MVSFNAAASALVLLASTTLSAADTIRSNRRLSYESIAGYEPMSQVTDHVSKIDRSCCSVLSLMWTVLLFYMGSISHKQAVTVVIRW